MIVIIKIFMVTVTILLIMICFKVNKEQGRFVRRNVDHCANAHHHNHDLQDLDQVEDARRDLGHDQHAHHHNDDLQDQDQVEDAKRAGKLVGTDGRR